MGEEVEKLKQRWLLLDYLQGQNWVAQPAGYDSEFVGLCPLHEDTRPSFYVNARKKCFLLSWLRSGWGPHSLCRVVPPFILLSNSDLPRATECSACTCRRFCRCAG